MRTVPETRKCPFCAEDVQPEARKCKHCGEWLDGDAQAPLGPEDTAQRRPSSRGFSFGDPQRRPRLALPPTAVLVAAGVLVVLFGVILGWPRDSSSNRPGGTTSERSTRAAFVAAAYPPATRCSTGSRRSPTPTV
jgi:hypothetical protein